jgi:hypothetical protein
MEADFHDSDHLDFQGATRFTELLCDELRTAPCLNRAVDDRQALASSRTLNVAADCVRSEAIQGSARLMSSVE